MKLLLNVIHTTICDQKSKVLPCLEGEGEWLCRPYCRSHSSLSFSRLSRSLNTEPLGQNISTHTDQTVHTHTHTFTHRKTDTQILTSCGFCAPWPVALPLSPVKQTHRERSDKSVSCIFCLIFKIIKRQKHSTHTCRLCSCCWIFTCAAFLSALAAGWNHRN